MADLQESGVPVTYGYIADLHANNSPGLYPQCQGAGEPRSGFALGPGDPCYQANAAAYDAAFATFFQRLAAGGITPSNTLFVFTADEGDHFVGANAGRAIAPTCTGTPGTTSYTCTYGAGQIGELNTNLTGLLATEKGDTTSFTLEADSAPEFYVNGEPGATDTVTRSLERNVADLQRRTQCCNASGLGLDFARSASKIHANLRRRGPPRQRQLRQRGVAGPWPASRGAPARARPPSGGPGCPCPS